MQNTANELIEVKFLVNPFKDGDEVIVPKGSKFTSMDFTINGVMSSLRKQSITVDHCSNGYVDPHYLKEEAPQTGEVIYHSRVSTVVYPGNIVYSGAGGYWKIVQLSEELIKANGMNPEYEICGHVNTITGSYRSALHQSI